jgi:hypothetical protein
MNLAVPLSSLAILIAAASAVFTKSGRDETRQLRRIEDDRRHDERRPALHAELEDVDGGEWHRLWLVLESSEPLDSVGVEILDKADVSFADDQMGVKLGAGPTTVAAWNGLPVGVKEAAWRVVIGRDAPESIRLRTTPSIGGESWLVLLTVPVPSRRGIVRRIR